MSVSLSKLTEVAGVWQWDGGPAMPYAAVRRPLVKGEVAKVLGSSGLSIAGVSAAIIPNPATILALEQPPIDSVHIIDHIGEQAERLAAILSALRPADEIRLYSGALTLGGEPRFPFRPQRSL